MSRKIMRGTLSAKTSRLHRLCLKTNIFRALASMAAFAMLVSPPAALYAEVVQDEVLSALHPVVEPDWLSLLENKAREAQRLGLIEAERKKTQQLFKAHAARPVEVLLPKAEKIEKRRDVIFGASRSRIMNDEQRSLIAGFQRTYVFINADDEDEVKWLLDCLGFEGQDIKKRADAMDFAMKAAEVRVVAVAGDVIRLSERLKTRVWADQGGVLVKRFGVTARPSIVQLKGRRTSAGEAEVVVEVQSVALDRNEDASGA